MRPGRYAAIDIGTVTCRMLVADLRISSGTAAQITALAKEYAVTNLGEGVDRTRCLSKAALERVMAVIDRFLSVRDSFDTPNNPVLSTIVMATSASRDAENADEFAALLAARGLDLTVIPGEMEAALSFEGASAAYSGEYVIVVDVGGGSTEMSMGLAGKAPARSHSFNVGCRRATERFWDGYPPSAEAIEAARVWMRSCFEDWCLPNIGLIFGSSSIPARMLAVAGTATSAVSIRDAIEPYDSTRVNGVEVTLAEIAAMQKRLSEMTLSDLQHVSGLDPARAPVIVAGMVILEEAMRAARVKSFTASEADILEGMIMYNARHCL